MIRGVAAEAVRTAVVHLDGVTGKVLGSPEVRDLSADVETMCKPKAPR